jgi:hypothetical protein
MRSIQLLAASAVLLPLMWIGVRAADAPSGLFAAVPVGRIIVLNIGDLTHGSDKLAGEVARIIQNFDPAAWKGNFKAAAMRVSPNQITLKASDEICNYSQKVVESIRIARTLSCEIQYRLVTNDNALSASTRPAVLVNDIAKSFEHAGELISPSTIILRSGEPGTLLDGTDLSLPTLSLSATASPDHRQIVLSITDSSQVPSSTQRIPQTMTFPLANGQSAAIRVGDTADHQWLLLNVALVQQQKVPVLSPSPIGPQ